ncbi:MAG TPA: hypothetical protein VGI71_12080 [Scandinavium sp.]|jgi:hypothetical protein
MSFNDLIRAKVICYTADGILQDSLIKLDTGISTALPVGAVVDEDGESAASTDSIAYVLVEPAKAGDKYLIVANPEMVVLNAEALETSLDHEAVLTTLLAKGYVFADYGTVGFRTT